MDYRILGIGEDGSIQRIPDLPRERQRTNNNGEEVCQFCGEKQIEWRFSITHEQVNEDGIISYSHTTDEVGICDQCKEILESIEDEGI